MCNRDQVSLKLSRTKGKLVNTLDKVYYAAIYKKINTCTSCVFNGFKYISKIRITQITQLNTVLRYIIHGVV